MNKVAFFITHDQIQALKALVVSEVPASAFKRATWQSLVKKGLVTLDPAPRLTPSGQAVVTMCERLTIPSKPTRGGNP